MAARYRNTYSRLFDQKRALTCGAELPLIDDSRRFWERVRAFEEIATIRFTDPCYCRAFNPPQLDRYEFMGALFVGEWRPRQRRFDYCWLPLFYGASATQFEFWTVLRVTSVLKARIRDWQSGHGLGLFQVSEYEKSLFGRNTRTNRLNGLVGGDVVSFMSPSVDTVVSQVINGFTTVIWQSAGFLDQFYFYKDGRIDRSKYFVPSVKYDGLVYNA